MKFKVMTFVIAFFIFNTQTFAFEPLPMVSKDGLEMLRLNCTEKKKTVTCLRSKIRIENDGKICRIVNVLNEMIFEKKGKHKWIAGPPFMSIRIDTLEKKSEFLWTYQEAEIKDAEHPNPPITNYSTENRDNTISGCVTFTF